MDNADRAFGAGKPARTLTIWVRPGSLSGRLDFFKGNEMHKKCVVCGNKSFGKEFSYCILHCPDNLRCSVITIKGTRCRLPKKDGLDICKTHYDARYTHTRCGNKFGYVYIFDTGLSQGNNHVYKIGKSNNPILRERELRQGSFGKMIHTAFAGTGASTLEYRIHKKYHHLNIERELYSLSTSDLADVLIDMNNATVAMP